jgi:hypothetical protein
MRARARLLLLLIFAVGSAAGLSTACLLRWWLDLY